jgi:hypothetical protein
MNQRILERVLGNLKIARKIAIKQRIRSRKQASAS